MSINVVGLADSARVPGIKLAVILGGPGTSPGAAQKTLLLIGNGIGSALSGSSPSYSLAAGTATAGTVSLLSSSDDAASLHGLGSELHRMALAVFAQYPDAVCYTCPVAESGGSAATAVYTFATTASAAYTVRVFIAGTQFDVAISSGRTATQIATDVATAINQVPNLPVYAQFSTGALTLTAKCKGTRGNDIVCDLSFVPSTGRPVRITTSSTSSGSGTTCTLSGNGTMGSEYLLSGGTTADTITAATTAIAATAYDRIVSALRDTTAVDALLTQVNSQAGVTSQLLQQVIVASNDTISNATTFATGRNQARLQCAWEYASPLPPSEVAAQVAAGRLVGDSILVGEATDPAANLDGLVLASTPCQRFPADRPTATDLQSALSNGLTPLSPADTGGLAVICRSITTRSLANGQPNYAVMDTTNVTVPDAVAQDLRGYLATQLKGAKIGTEDSNGTPPLAAGVVTPKGVKSLVYSRLKLREDSGWIRNVDAHLPLLDVQPHTGVPGRLDAEIPCEPVPGLHIFGGNVRQLS